MAPVPSKPNLPVVYFLSFLGDLSLSLTLVFSVFLGTALGASTVEIGFIGGAYGAIYCISPILFGRVSDKYPRKYSLLIALGGILGVSLFNSFLAARPLDLILSNGALGLFAGFFWPNVEAFFSESSGERHSQALGNFCIAWSLGYMIGPFIAGFLYPVHPRSGFYLVAIIGLAGVILTQCLLPRDHLVGEELSHGDALAVDPTGAVHHAPRSHESQNDPESGTKPIHTSPTPSSSTFSFGHILAFMSIATLGYAFGKQILVALFPNYAVLEQGLGWTEPQAGVVLFVMGLGRTAAFAFVRFHPKRDIHATIVLGSLLFGATLIGVSLTRDLIVMTLLFLVIGTCQGFLYAGGLELTLTASAENKGRNAGVFEGIVGTGSVIAPVIGGFLAGWNLALPYLVMGILFVSLGTFLLVLVLRGKK